jgi:hypothetical protein
MEPADYNSWMLRRCALAAGALLAGFHAWLLATQVWSGHVAQPDVLLRWLAAAALVAGLTALGRRGVPVLVSRQAIAVWLLAALLHGPALANDLDGFATPSLPEAAVALTQSALAVSAVGLALLALWLRATSPRLAPGAVAAVVARVPARPRSASAGLGFLPRPPPLR